MTRRYRATIGDEATLSRVPRIPAEIEPRRRRPVPRVLEVSFGHRAGPALGSGGYVAGGSSSSGDVSNAPSAGSDGCVGCE